MIRIFDIGRNTGYQFVMVFFVLSGFFITSSVLKLIQNDRWSWKFYLINRLSRLWIVLIPALILAYIWFVIQSKMFGPVAYFNGTLGIETFIQNGLFLADIHNVPLFADNGPLWSLTYEFWYYLLFPCIVLCIVDNRLSRRFLYGAIVIAIALFVGPRIMEYFAIWLLGSVIAVLKPMQIHGRNKQLILVFGSVVLSVISLKLLYVLWSVTPSWNGQSFIPDLSVALSFAFLIYNIVSFYNKKGRKQLKIFPYLAGFSYTLYLCHYPVLHFVRSWLHINGTYSSVMMYGLVLIFILIYAWIVSRFTENRTSDMRRFLYKVIQTKTEKNKSLSV